MARETREASAQRGKRKLSPSEISVFCSQISIFMRAGVTLIEGISLLLEDLEQGRLRAAVESIAGALKERKTLSEAVEKTGVFPEYLMRMVKIGETSGTLDETMASISAYYERESALKQRIKNAVTYPIVLVCMMAAVVMLLIMRVLPTFDSILKSLGRPMPPLVRGLMDFGRFVGDNALVAAAVLAVVVAAFVLTGRTSAGREFFDRIKMSLPFVRPVMQKIASERFATAMSFLLKSDIDIEQAVDMSKELAGNSYLTNKIDRCLKLSRKGDQIFDAIAEAGIFPRLFTRMLSIGVKTGDLDEIMGQLSRIYEQESDAALRKLTAIIEPAFVAVLSVIVGVILVSVMLPLIDIMSSIG